MPVIHVHIIEGRTNEQKEAIIHEVTDAMMRAINSPKESVRVIIQDMPKQNFGIGGVSVKSLGR